MNRITKRTFGMGDIMSSVFETRVPDVAENQRLRVPQRDGFQAIDDYYSENPGEREIGIILPVGCGKSGLIALSPFAVKSKKTLVIAPEPAEIRGTATNVSDLEDADVVIKD